MAITHGLDGSGQGLWAVLLNEFPSTSIKQITKNIMLLERGARHPYGLASQQL
jgi:hypothetical protein